jgi:hypothetical protein
MLHELRYKHIVLEQSQLKMCLCPPFCGVESAAGASLSRSTVCNSRTVEAGNRDGVAGALSELH